MTFFHNVRRKPQRNSRFLWLNVKITKFLKHFPCTFTFKMHFSVLLMQFIETLEGTHVLAQQQSNSRSWRTRSSTLEVNVWKPLWKGIVKGAIRNAWFWARDFRAKSEQSISLLLIECGVVQELRILEHYMVI